MAKKSPFIPSAVPRMRPSFPPLVAISHPEVENPVVSVDHSAVLFNLSFAAPDHLESLIRLLVTKA